MKKGWEGQPKGLLQVLWERGWIDEGQLEKYTIEPATDDDGEVLEGAEDWSLKCLMASCLDFAEEMTALQHDKIENLIPIATDWKATDWVIANVLIQDQILNNSDDPIADARLHAMLLYRTPQSINERFQREKLNENSIFQIENWLVNHGIKLKKRFRLSSYKLMNHLLKTNDITRERNNFQSVITSINANIHIVAVDTDYFFIADENRKDYQQAKLVKENVFYHEINSIHGHDAFLIEFNQLAKILSPIFIIQKQQKYVSA